MNSTDQRPAPTTFACYIYHQHVGPTPPPHPDEELWEEAAAGRNPLEALVREAVVCHNTFLALSRQHARLLLRFPAECPKAYKRVLRLGDHRRFIPLTCVRTDESLLPLMDGWMDGWMDGFDGWMEGGA